MGLTLKAGRWFDANRPMDDMTIPYPHDQGVEKAHRRARRQRRPQRICGARSSASNRRRTRSARSSKSELLDDGTGIVDINIIGVVGDSRFRSVRTPIDPIMFQQGRRPGPAG